MKTQFITNAKGKKMAVVVPFDEWERTEKAKEILEHVYLAEIIQQRKDSNSSVTLDELVKAEGLSRTELES